APFVEPCAQHFGVKANVWHQFVLCDAVLLVAVDVPLTRIKTRPVKILLEGERVQWRRDVACRPGVSVVPPGAADLVGLFEHHEVGDPGLPQLNRHPDATKSGPDDYGGQGLLCCCCAAFHHGLLLAFCVPWHVLPIRWSRLTPHPEAEKSRRPVNG